MKPRKPSTERESTQAVVAPAPGPQERITTGTFWRRLSLGFLMPLALACAASTTVMAFDIFEWQGPVDQARDLLDDLPDDADLRRRLNRQAIGAINRDWKKSRAVLRSMLDDADPRVAKDAAATLDYINASSQR
jgi:hypothetical protein